METLQYISDLVWGPYLVVLLLGTGIYFTFRLFFIQVRYLFYGLRISLGKDDHSDSKEKKGDISYFQALATSLSATIGTGNIVGVAGALLIGGPGALFWMWITAFIGMATKYAEALLAVKYRTQTKHGYAGGPMYYIENGLGQKWLGILFALFTLVAALGIGNTVQANAAAGALSASSLEVPRIVSSIVIAFFTGMVILGGVKRIGKIASYIVPFMGILYIGGASWIIFSHYELIPQTFSLIFTYAFNPISAAAGGFGALLAMTINIGIKRGLFSNEAGLGSAPIAAASAKTEYPVKQALVSMLGPFIDTLIICSLTGFVILIGLQVYSDEAIIHAIHSKESAFKILGGSIPEFKNFIAESQNASDLWKGIIDIFSGNAVQMKDVLTSSVFYHALGPIGKEIVIWGLFLFVISTIIGWYHYSDRALLYLGGGKYIQIYRLFYVLMVIVGGLGTNIGLIWKLSDIANALMAIPNLIALILLSGVVISETKKYFQTYPHKYDFIVWVYVQLLSFLPKNTISKLAGSLARLKLPRFIMIPVILAFSKITGINADEAQLSLTSYPSLNQLFIRYLKNGVRIIDQQENIIVSPVDGTLLSSGKISKGEMVQAKGIEFSIKDLLGTDTFFNDFSEAEYAIIYLSPHDYHRIHSPYSGKILGYYYKPGKLFPVNAIAVSTIKKLFSRNERLITYLQTDHGKLAVIKIGATNVGKIKVEYDSSITTNNWFRSSKEKLYLDEKRLTKGEELGRFELGSTVIVIIENQKGKMIDMEKGQKIRYGEPIGIFHDSDNKKTRKSFNEK